MKRVMILVCAFMFVAALAFAAGPKVYQMDGTVYLIKDGSIVVQKGNDKYEIKQDSTTKVAGNIKQGSKVTIQYTMTATKIEVSEDKQPDTQTKK